MNNFTLTDKQIEDFQKFRNEHNECVDPTIGGKFSFIFTPTGLGNIVEVQCNICKENKDITEYEYW